MTQYVINIGSLPNDGTGDPLRTAFNETNLNFDQVFAAGPVLSNIRIANNTILTTNTNGNLVLAPNGIGRIQANATVVPSVANVRDLGSLTQRWNTVYTQNLNASGFITGQFGNITVAVGNLHISGGSNGYVLQTDGNGNLTWTAQTGGSGNAVPAGANTQVQFNNAGSFGADPDFYFNNTTNTLVVNGNLNQHSVELGNQGFTPLASNVIAQITGNANSYTQVNFQNINSGNRATTDYVATAAFGTDSTYYVNMGIAGDSYDNLNPNNSLGTSLFPQDSYLYAQGGNSVGGTGGNLVVGTNEPGGVVRVIANGSNTANIVATFSNAGIDVKGNIIPVASNTYSLGNSTNQWSDLYVSNATIYMNNVPLSLTAGNVLTVNNEPVLTNDSSTSISTTGNITANYFLGNVEGLIGNITNLNSVNFAVENIGALIGNNGVNIGAGGNNNLVVLPDEVLIQNVPLTVAGNIRSTVAGGLNITANTVANGVAQTWNFGTDGRLTFPGTPRIDTDSDNFEVQAAEAINLEANAVVNIYTDTSGTTKQWQFGDSGDLSVPGDVQFADGSFITDNLEATGDFGISTAANVGFMIDTNEAAHTWTFDTTGNLNLPTNGSINFDTGGIVQAVDEDFSIRVQDADDDGFALLLQVDDGAGTVLGSTELQRDRYVVQFAGGGAPQFTFNENGEFSVPGNIRTNEYVDSSLYAVSDNSENGSVELKVISYAGDVLGSNVRVTQSNATISTGNAQHTWNFDLNGNLTLPLSGNLVGSTPNNNGYINWLGNSSGDGYGYTTMRLVPDDTREGSDQYLIIDPTAPGHIHIRAGGTQDNSGSDLFLGGENSYFKVNSGANNNVTVASNSNQWTFDTTGNLTIPKNIHGHNDGSGLPLVIDAGTQGFSYISVPSFQDGGEEIVIKNTYSGSNIRLQTNGGNLLFDNVGTLTIPGDLVAALASPAPSISGFSSIGSLTSVTAPVAYATLTPIAGARAFVNDGNLVASGNFGAQISGSGSNTVPVWSDGTNWYIG